MKIMLGDFNAKVGRVDIFKLTIGNESSNDHGVRLANFATSKNFTVKSTMNIRMNLRQVGWGDVDCIGLAQERDK
jgi:hypothetical protein